MREIDHGSYLVTCYKFTTEVLYSNPVADYYRYSMHDYSNGLQEYLNAQQICRPD